MRYTVVGVGGEGEREGRLIGEIGSGHSCGGE